MKKVVLALVGLGLIFSVTLAQMQAGFKGTTLYQQGMTLEDAYDLAAVSEEEAILTAQTINGVLTTPHSAEITVLDGFIVWAVDFGDQIIFVDVSDVTLNSSQSIMAEANADGESDDYEDDDEEYEDDDDDEEEYEDENDD